jgi:hypothetical protein
MTSGTPFLPCLVLMTWARASSSCGHGRERQRSGDGGSRSDGGGGSDDSSTSSGGIGGDTGGGSAVRARAE